MSGDNIAQYVGYLVQTFLSRNAVELNQAVPLEPNHQYFQLLRPALSTLPIGSITDEHVLKYLTGIDEDFRDTFARFIVALFKYIKTYGAGPTSAAIAAGDFTRLNAIYIEANRLFDTKVEGTFINGHLCFLIVSLAKTLAILGEKAAALSTEPERSTTSSRSIRDTTRKTIEASFRITTKKLGEADVDQQHCIGDIMYPISNILFRIYAKRKLHSIAVLTQRQINEAIPSEEARMQRRGYMMRETDLCESYYWRGRLGVVLLDFRNAKYWLDKAEACCPPDSYKQMRAILIRSIPVNLLLGKHPRLDILHQYSLQAFLPLINAYLTGNIVEWRKELERNNEWYRARQIWLILYERGEILVWRNLFRKAWKFYIEANPDKGEKGHCPTWVLRQAMVTAFKGSGEVEEGRAGVDDIVCMIASLIDHGFILGYLSYSNQTMVLKKGDGGMAGFPPIHTVTPRPIVLASRQ